MVEVTGSNRPGRRIRRRPASDQSFVSYLPFGLQTTVCLGLFLAIYAIALLLAVPLLGRVQEIVVRGSGSAASAAHHDQQHHQASVIEHGEALVDSYKNFELQKVAESVKHRVADFRHQTGVSDANLLEKAAQSIHHVRQRRQSTDGDGGGGDEAGTVGTAAVGKRSGFMVLGMHRSGTSMLSGLLVNGMGYETGGPLIGSAFDNEKGFFERLDVVLQNDEFMRKQHGSWESNAFAYEGEQGIKDKKSGKVTFEKGEKALQFLNNPNSAPWLQKDPRMCITLKTWLPLLDNEPAIVFTYRHPLEVAHSLKKREKFFNLDHGLRIWIVYNMRAIENSDGLCRVLTSNEAIFADPLKETQRISKELTDTCGVPAPPQQLTQEEVDKFVDPELQHNKKKTVHDDVNRKVIMKYDNGCEIRDFDSDYDKIKDAAAYDRERGLYIKAMRIYCDLQNGEAYDVGYMWPDLN